MSRAYRIAVKENLKRIIRAKDHVSTQVEILEVLPKEQMAQLLKEELQRRGFQEKGKQLVRSQNGVTVTVDPTDGTVKVESERQENVELEGERVGRAWDDAGPNSKQLKDQLRKELVADLEKQAGSKEAELQKAATDALESQLGDLRQELDRAVNRVTAEALKQKAATLGSIKEMTEDAESGSLTIVLEV
jgi:fructose-1,6-bisphosphatase/inositol monophosphatase family enzyme